MRHVITITALLGATALSLACASGALAADMPMKAPVAVPYNNWTGWYAGASVGARMADTTWTTTSIAAPPFGPTPPRTGNSSIAGLDSTSARLGGYAGYNWQFAPTWVAGIEADLAWGNNKKSVSPIPGTVFAATSCSTFANCTLDSITAKEGWDGSLRARLGFLVSPTWLVYATGGAAWQQFSLTAICSAPTGPWCIANRSEAASWTRVGWTLGGGVETMLGGNWFARADYRYADFGTVTKTFFVSAPADAVTMSEPLRTHTATLGLAYKFGR
jgi:outer membrane immunogenic protein